MSAVGGGAAVRPVEVIACKRDGGQLSEAQVEAFVKGVVTGGWDGSQIGALLMAIYLRGMTAAETAQLTRAMVESGRRLEWGEATGVVDKHSTGGVGDKLSLVIAPLAAACGLRVPMISGRGLGHTGGTLDKLESIAGLRVDIEEAALAAQLAAVGTFIIGQTAALAPADRILYATRDTTGTVACLPLIVASILSKKVASGISGLVMDVKCGRGAFMKGRAEARALAESLVAVGGHLGVKVQALVTAMDAPIGRTVGNSVEVVEAIEVLRGAGPKDVRELSIELVAAMCEVGGLRVERGEIERRLDGGEALAVMRRMLEAQGGDVAILEDTGRLGRAAIVEEVTAERSGWVAGIDSLEVAEAVNRAGAGRARSGDTVDHHVGLSGLCQVGERVEAGATLGCVHAQTAVDARRIEAALRAALTWSDAPVAADGGARILERVTEVADAVERGRK